MAVTEAYDLTAPGHPRLKRFVRLALPEGTPYRTGDHVTVLPVNDKALVERAATALGVDLDTVLDIRAARPRRDGLAVDGPLTVRQLITHHSELQETSDRRPTGRARRRQSVPPERRQLATLADDPRTPSR
ncbi:hypothetical protein ABT173_39375 [Streptomyces sp. NPDC001795]|uniref:hypothetical protein n=1 Tax=Streptomyces sp. NPDC001795 TaxID=3154525 RepID=UPI00332325A9